jgi:hypothetical protein
MLHGTLHFGLFGVDTKHARFEVFMVVDTKSMLLACDAA